MERGYESAHAQKIVRGNGTNGNTPRMPNVGDAQINIIDSLADRLNEATTRIRVIANSVCGPETASGTVDKPEPPLENNVPARLGALSRTLRALELQIDRFETQAAKGDYFEVDRVGG